MTDKSPLNKQQILNDCKKSSMITTILMIIGIIAVGAGIIMLFVLPIAGLSFIAAFGLLFIYLPSGLRKQDKEDLRLIKNDDYQVIEDRIIKKRIKSSPEEKGDGNSYYIYGTKTEKSFTVTRNQYEDLKIGDYFYYGLISNDRVTGKYLASEWCVDPSLQLQFISWSEDDEEMFVKKRAETEKVS